MSGDQSSDARGGPPPIPSRGMPPPIPRERSGTSHAPPPIPTRPAAIGENTAMRSEPPPVPGARPSSIGPPEVPRRVVNDRPVNIIVGHSMHHEPVILSRLALVLILLCIPLAFLGSFWPFLRSPFWLTSLVLAFVALSLAKFTINSHSSGPPTPLSKLTLQLSYGFIIISIIGLIAAAFRASMFLSGTADRLALAVRSFAEAQKGTNDQLAWIFHKIDVIISYFGTHHAAGTLPAASPSPSPAPTP